MSNNIVFIGGIHGVGKSTICQHICRELNMEYLSASKLLKWEEINDDAKNKKVNDIPFTQNRLIIGLSKIIQKGHFYLLDGHFCLLNEKEEVEKISKDIFMQINPKVICLILGDISEIKTRLDMRDNKTYEFGLLEQLQNSELDYARQLSVALEVPLFIEDSVNSIKILNHLSKIYGQN